MRSLLFVLTCLVAPAFICVALPADERVTLSDHNADGKITAKIYSQTDTCLSQTVSYEARLKSVKQIISDLREMTGVSIMAGTRESDWPVRSRKMNIFVKDVPLYELMDSIARVMKFRWSRSDDDKMIYRLKVNSKAAAQADAMMKRAEKMQEQVWQKRRQEWADAIDKYGDKSASELISLRDTEPQIYEQALLGSLQAAHALFEEVPETRDRFLAGKNFRVAGDDVDPETKMLFYNAGNEFWKHLQRIGYVGETKTQNPPGYGPAAVQPNDSFDIVYQRLDVGMFTPNLRWGSASVSDTGYWHLYRNTPTRVNMDFEINGFRYLGTEWNRHISKANIRINEGEDIDEVRSSEEDAGMSAYTARHEDAKKLEESLYPSEPLIEHANFSQLDQKITLKMEKPKPDTNPMMVLGEYVASFQKALSEASGINVVSDSWLSIPAGNLSIPDKETKLAELLDAFCSSFNYNWDKPGTVLEFRYRKWAKMRLNQIPDEWVAIWSKNTKETSFLSLDDVASISNITYYQAEESLKQDPVIGAMGIYDKILDRLDNNLAWLRFYSSLNQQQKTILFDGKRGLFGSMLTSEQWNLAQPMFDRIGITRSEALMQTSIEFGDDNPKYTVWFREIDTDSGQIDRLWKLILPRYTPPPPVELEGDSQGKK